MLKVVRTYVLNSSQTLFNFKKSYRNIFQNPVGIPQEFLDAKI